MARPVMLLAVMVAFVAVAAATSLKPNFEAQSPALHGGFHIQRPHSLVDPNAPTWCSICVRSTYNLRY
jgi:Spy/CpxP family protein refolding chaperone